MGNLAPIQIPVLGGLGNQMFQAANAIALAHQKYQEPHYIDFTGDAREKRDWQLGCFDIHPSDLSKTAALGLKARIFLARKIMQIRNRPTFGVFCEENPLQYRTGSTEFTAAFGYWQSEAHFKDFRAEIVSTFTFPEIPRNPTLDEIASSENSVAVHIRRGDYVHDPVARDVHFVCDLSWYISAIEQTRKAIPNCHFFLFSDDKEWAKANFGTFEDCTIVEGTPDDEVWVDMAAMSKCNHFIISNSSYSWWASYLGKNRDSYALAPKYWFRGQRTEDLGIYQADWNLL